MKLHKPDLWQIGIALTGTCIVGLVAIDAVLPIIFLQLERGEFNSPIGVDVALVSGALGGAVILLIYSIRSRENEGNR